MQTYIILCHLTAQAKRNRAESLKSRDKTWGEFQKKGMKITAYDTLGPYDVVMILESPSEELALKFLSAAVRRETLRPPRFEPSATKRWGDSEPRRGSSHGGRQRFAHYRRVGQHAIQLVAVDSRAVPRGSMRSSQEGRETSATLLISTLLRGLGSHASTWSSNLRDANTPRFEAHPGTPEVRLRLVHRLPQRRLEAVSVATPPKVPGSEAFASTAAPHPADSDIERGSGSSG